MDFFDINIEQTNWQDSSETLSAIRHQVFVKEQHIPESLELDGQDDNATHWLVSAPDKTPIATARMLDNGKVGRMAVLADYRGKGVASALLRRIIRFAQSREMDSLTMDAQAHAAELFERFGFDTESEPFDVAGIPHATFTLPLSRFYRPSPQPEPRQVSPEEREHQPFENADAFIQHAIQLLAKGERKVRIFSDKMDPQVYNDKHYCQLIQQIATSHPQAEIRILVRNNLIIKAQSVGLAELAGRLGSNMEVRLANRHLDNMRNDYMVVDEAGILLKQEEQRYQGYSVAYSPMAARDLANEFDAIWDHSQKDPELRRLGI